ncbi:MAG: ABC transporter permease subunit [Lentisphaerota bacterium]
MNILHPTTWIHPLTRKRLQRFRGLKRAWWAFWILVAIYGLSLFSELLCNEKPLWVRYNGKSYFPIFRFYPDDTFTGSGQMTRPNYKKLAETPSFAPGSGSRMVFPLIPYGPLEILAPASIHIPDEVKVVISREPRVASVDVDPQGVMVRYVNAEILLDAGPESMNGQKITAFVEIPTGLDAAIAQRFKNEQAPAVDFESQNKKTRPVALSLSPFSPRSQPPKTVRLTLREQASAIEKPASIMFSSDGNVKPGSEAAWAAVDGAMKPAILEGVQKRFAGTATTIDLSVGEVAYRARFEREEVRFPFRPVEGHPMGIDSAGRDVLARLLYGLRTSMTFGILLVIAAMLMGTLIGAVQGYYGGMTDLVGQRLIEIWESMPFLYVLILLGSIYGQGFMLLLIVYGIFNWIGISFYMRAEFLRLRKLPFVESARCMGLRSHKIILRHILPNALVPLITFFPFSLVGSIGVLAALDYLGFGLPPPTPSWGEMLSQAQEYNWAWWLVLYPSLALFAVMLLCVFVGEGVRTAFDPRKFSKME